MKTTVSILCLFLSIALSAQEKATSVYPWEFGFSLGATRSAITANLPENKFGFELGIHTKKRFGKSFAFNPGVYFGYNEASTGGRTIFKQYLSFTPSVLYQFKPDGNSPYLSLGPNIKHRIASNEEEITTNLLPSSYGADLGVGWFCDLKHFNLQTEVRYSYGFNNMRNLLGFFPVNYHSIGVYFQFID